MLGHALQTHSLQESHSGPTPSPAWDQAIVLSNRGPVSQVRGADGSIRITPVLRWSRHCTRAARPGCSGTWVACGTLAGDTRAQSSTDWTSAVRRRAYRLVTSAFPRRSIAATTMDSRTRDSGPCAMPFGVQPVFRPSDFLAYRAANTRFAAAVADEATCAAPLLLVQDYHFALAPRELRHRLPLSTIVTFWHIPWPSLHVLRLCPVGRGSARRSARQRYRRIPDA